MGWKTCRLQGPLMQFENFRWNIQIAALEQTVCDWPFHLQPALANMRGSSMVSHAAAVPGIHYCCYSTYKYSNTELLIKKARSEKTISINCHLFCSFSKHKMWRWHGGDDNIIASHVSYRHCWNDWIKGAICKNWPLREFILHQVGVSISTANSTPHIHDCSSSLHVGSVSHASWLSQKVRPETFTQLLFIILTYCTLYNFKTQTVCVCVCVLLHSTVSVQQTHASDTHYTSHFSELVGKLVLNSHYCWSTICLVLLHNW